MFLLNIARTTHVVRGVRKFTTVSPRQSQHNVISIITQESCDQLKNSLNQVINSVCTEKCIAPEIIERIQKITEYTSTDGKTLRGMLTINAYELLENKNNISEESLQQIRALAWGAEMVHAYFVISNSIEAGVCTLRGNSDVSTDPANDACLIRSFLYEMLKQNFFGKSTYINLFHLFETAFLNTAIGQYWDNATCKSTGFDNFSMDRYNTIVKYKSAFSTFKLPALLAMTMAKKITQESYQTVDEIFCDIGRLYQIQNDYFECYGVSDIRQWGKTIQKGKCSWLAIAALQRCSLAQRVVFTTCYGSNEPAHIERVKRLYDQLHLPALFENEKQVLYTEIIRKVRVSRALPPNLFMKPLEVIFNRSYW